MIIDRFIQIDEEHGLKLKPLDMANVELPGRQNHFQQPLPFLHATADRLISSKPVVQLYCEWLNLLFYVHQYGDHRGLLDHVIDFSDALRQPLSDFGIIREPFLPDWCNTFCVEPIWENDVIRLRAANSCNVLRKTDEAIALSV